MARGRWYVLWLGRHGYCFPISGCQWGSWKLEEQKQRKEPGCRFWWVLGVSFLFLEEKDCYFHHMLWWLRCKSTGSWIMGRKIISASKLKGTNQVIKKDGSRGIQWAGRWKLERPMVGEDGDTPSGYLPLARRLNVAHLSIVAFCLLGFLLIELRILVEKIPGYCFHSFLILLSSDGIGMPWSHFLNHNF